MLSQISDMCCLCSVPCVRVYLLTGPDGGYDLQPRGKFPDISGKEGSQCVAVVRPVKLGLVQPVNQYYESRPVHVQLPL